MMENLFDDNTQTRISPVFSGNPNIVSVIKSITSTCTREFMQSSQNTDKKSMVTTLPKNICEYVADTLIYDGVVKQRVSATGSSRAIHAHDHNKENKKPQQIADDTYDSDGWLNIDPVGYPCIKYCACAVHLAVYITL